MLLANPIEDRNELQQFREATGSTDIIIARLRAPLATMQERVRRRDPGMWQQKYVDRVQALEELLDSGAVEDFVVVNDGSVTTVAREVLQRAEWALKVVATNGRLLARRAWKDATEAIATLSEVRSATAGRA